MSNFDIDDHIRDQKSIGKDTIEWGDIGWFALKDYMESIGHKPIPLEDGTTIDKGFVFWGIKHRLMNNIRF